MALNTKNDLGVLKRNGIKVLKELVGMYEGQEELSYLVPNSKNAMVLAGIFQQECVLVLSTMENGKRRATSVQPIPHSTHFELPLGEFKNVGQNKPTQDCWTFDIETGNYFVIV